LLSEAGFFYDGTLTIFIIVFFQITRYVEDRFSLFSFVLF